MIVEALWFSSLVIMLISFVCVFSCFAVGFRRALLIKDMPMRWGAEERRRIVPITMAIFSVLGIIVSLCSYYAVNYFWISNVRSLVKCENGVAKYSSESVVDPFYLLEGLSDLSKTKRSGSRPTVSVDVAVKCNGNVVNVYFKKDSRDPNLYWVYPDLPFHGGVGYIHVDKVGEKQ